jgi:hypothetical protein
MGAQLVDHAVHPAVSGRVDVGERGAVLVQEPLQSGQRVQGCCMRRFTACFSFGREDEAPGPRDVAGASSARAVAPNAEGDGRQSSVRVRVDGIGVGRAGARCMCSEHDFTRSGPFVMRSVAAFM